MLELGDQLDRGWLKLKANTGGGVVQVHITVDAVCGQQANFVFRKLHVVAGVIKGDLNVLSDGEGRSDTPEQFISVSTAIKTDDLVVAVPPQLTAFGVQ